MKTFTRLTAAAILTAGLAGGAFAQSEEPDCPEDFDTEPGCDMSQMDGDPSEEELPTSERSPVPGAATAPTSENEGEGSTSLANPTEDAPEPSEEGSSDPVEGEVDSSESDSSSAVTEGDASSSGSASSSDEMDSEASASASGDEESASAASGGSDHEVMARGVKFAPAVIFIQPGDTVNWTNMPSHNVETISDMMPEGAPEINSEIGAPVSQTFETEGIIVYKCTPHWGNRMGGVIIVGDPENPMETIDAYMQAAEENTENLPALGLLKDARAQLEEQS